MVNTKLQCKYFCSRTIGKGPWETYTFEVLTWVHAHGNVSVVAVLGGDLFPHQDRSALLADVDDGDGVAEEAHPLFFGGPILGVSENISIGL